MLQVLHYILQLLGFHGQNLPLGRQSHAIPVPEVQGFVDPAKFFQEHVIPGQPVVFKGAAKEFPAFQRWSDEYFLSFDERLAAFLSNSLNFGCVFYRFSITLSKLVMISLITS